MELERYPDINRAALVVKFKKPFIDWLIYTSKEHDGDDQPRDRSAEVDFVVRSSSRAVGIEVKSSGTLDFKDTRSMREFLKNHPQVSRGIIVYTGDKIYSVATNIYAVRWVEL